MNEVEKLAKQRVAVATEVEKTEAEVATLEKERGSLTLDALGGDQGARNKLAALNRRLATAHDKLDGLNAAIQEADRRLAEERAKIDAAKQQQAEGVAALARLRCLEDQAALLEHLAQAEQKEQQLREKAGLSWRLSERAARAAGDGSAPVPLGSLEAVSEEIARLKPQVNGHSEAGLKELTELIAQEDAERARRSEESRRRAQIEAQTRTVARLEADLKEKQKDINSGWPTQEGLRKMEETLRREKARLAELESQERELVAAKR